MVPALRALADRWMYDNATVKHIATNLPEEGLERVTPESGWTVRQVLAHLAVNQQRYGGLLEKWLAGESPLDIGGDPTDRNAEMAEKHADTPVGEIVAMLDRGLQTIVSVANRASEADLSRSMDGTPAMQVITAWSRHYGAHAVDLVSALPEFKVDPLVLNWALYFDYTDRPEWHEWQRRLATEVREMFQLQGEED